GCYDTDACRPANDVSDDMIHAMGVLIAKQAFTLGISDLGRHNIKGFSELGARFPDSPGSLIMIDKNKFGVAPIDIIVEVAMQELSILNQADL
ncbi:MAG: hypothetical protein WCK42_09895, partial [Myxococcaceae bacterium]